MAEQHSSEARIIRCILSKGDGSQPVNLGQDMIAGFTVHESLLSPFMGGAIVLSDSKGLVNTYPIQGGENLEIEVKTTFEDAPIVYKFKIYKIYNRILKNKIQVYSLGLISSEALVNETKRITRNLTGNPESVVKDLLVNDLQTTKTVYSEASRFELKISPSRARPFDIISKVQNKSVSPKTDYAGANSTNTTETAQQIKGSAGFFFWETRRGFNFFSIDALCDVSEDGKFSAPKLQSQAWGPYIEAVANTDQSGDQRFLIKDFALDAEVDIIQSLRKGKYSSLMVFFNHSTGQYEEYVYKIKDSYDNMAHLGGQESVSLIPTNQIELSDYPTRIMSMLLDHESWYNDPGIANPEDPQAKDPTKFADWQKYYAAQGAARAELLKNQQGVLQIPGNPLVCAGDKIDLRIQSKLADAQRKRQPLDEESSGVYLVKETTQTYNFLEGSNGTLNTTLRLFRDSYGMKDKPSNHGNK